MKPGSKNNKGKLPEKGNAIKRNDFVGNSKQYFLLFACVFITLIAYIPAFTNGWTYWDDNAYVYENNLTKSLSHSTIFYFFTTFQVGNYHPLTMLSLALDYRFAGMNATWYHFHGILLHLINVVLVFFFVMLLTKKQWAAFFTALLFGIHPMHVESVAWISERKDLLYTLYYLAGLIAYLKFIQTKKVTLFVLTIVLFLLSLLSKGQAVTFTGALILVDYYTKRQFNPKVWLEKIPFFLLSILFGIAAILAQQHIKALHLDIPFSLADRLLFASNSLLNYLYKSILPLTLCAFYPYPVKTDGYFNWVFYVSPLIVLVIVAAVNYSIKKTKLIVFGFTFFLINIILILQVLAVGGAIMAERYTYLSYIGLFFIVGMGLQNVFDRTNIKKSITNPFPILVIAAFSVFFCVQTFARTKIWKNNETLFGDMLEKYPNIPEANYSLGLEYEKQDKTDLAIACYTKAIQQAPKYKEAIVHRFAMYKKTGQTDSAIADCNRQILLDKNAPGAYANRGIAYCISGKFDLAMNDFNKAIQLDPHDVKAFGNRGNLYDMKGKYDSAIADYNEALKYDATYTDPFGNRGRTYVHKGMNDEAIADLTLAMKYEPDNGEYYFLRSEAYNAKGNYQQALKDVLVARDKGRQIDPGYINMLKGKMESK